jgi:hypothetical protein
LEKNLSCKASREALPFSLASASVCQLTALQDLRCLLAAGAASVRRRTATISKLTKLTHNEDGATAIEYGLIAALIAVAAIAAYQLSATT